MFAIGNSFTFLLFIACQEFDCRTLLVLKCQACLSELIDCCLHCEQHLYFDNISTPKEKKTQNTKTKQQTKLKITLVAKSTVDRNREFTSLFCRLTCALALL